MKLGIIDYQYCRGGVERVIEGVLNNLPEEAEVTLFTAGEALGEYKNFIAKLTRPVTLVDHPITMHRSALVKDGKGILHGPLVYELPEELWQEQDIVWLPWVNRHAIPPACLVKTVATVHDVNTVELDEYLATKREPICRLGPFGLAAMEDMLMRRLMGSLARVVTISAWTREYLGRAYGPLLRVPEIIYSSLDHMAAVTAEPVNHLGLPPRYLILPATTQPNKNHEAAFVALAKVKAEAPQDFLPLVLTGAGTGAIAVGSDYRSAYLKALIAHLGLEIGRDLLLPGVLSTGQFRAVLQGASGLVFPTLAEGYGFPPLEAARVGVPVAVSDIKVMHETLDQIGAPALYFPPQDTAALAACLIRLNREGESLRAATAPCIGRNVGGSWADVGQRYWEIFREQMSVAALYQAYGG